MKKHKIHDSDFESIILIYFRDDSEPQLEKVKKMTHEIAIVLGIDNAQTERIIKRLVIRFDF